MRRRTDLPLRIGLCVAMLTVIALGGWCLAALGRLPWPRLSIYAGILVLAALGFCFGLDAGLLRERLRPAGGVDRATVRLEAVLLLGHLALALVDGRWRVWPLVTAWSAWPGALLLGGGLLLLLAAMRANRFFSAVVRVQVERAHALVTTGPYAHVRHPGYAALLMAVIGSGLLLGSGLSLAVAPVLVWAVARRVRIEERVLRAELPGYTTYCQEVRYVALPPIW